MTVLKLLLSWRKVAGGEGGKLGQEGVRILAALLAAHQPVAENVLLGEDFQLGIGEAGVERGQVERRARERR